MTPTVQLIVGREYYISGMVREMWDAPHEKYGAPESIAARYIGCVRGQRRWHAFEVWIAGRECGCLFMTDADVAKLHIVPLG